MACNFSPGFRTKYSPATSELKLLQGDARGDFTYIDSVHGIVRRVYTHYSRSPMRLRGLGRGNDCGWMREGGGRVSAPRHAEALNN